LEFVLVFGFENRYDNASLGASSSGFRSGLAPKNQTTWLRDKINGMEKMGHGIVSQAVLLGSSS
jgi:hypothetical protein